MFLYTLTLPFPKTLISFLPPFSLPSIFLTYTITLSYFSLPLDFILSHIPLSIFFIYLYNMEKSIYTCIYVCIYIYIYEKECVYYINIHMPIHVFARYLIKKSCM